jgi:hypothetical protein
VDYTDLDIECLRAYGPGPFLGPKLMLGSIDGDIDQSLKKRDSSMSLYGEKMCQLTIKEMKDC